MALTDDDCYIRLREAIMREEFLPNERLVEMSLAQSLGTGRAAVRTALARLEQDGLVLRERHRGARVRRISQQEAVEILEARAALEGVAVRYAALNASDAEVSELRAILDEQRRCLAQGDLLASSDVNERLHQAIVRIANHTTASRLLNMLKSHHVRFQYRTILVPGRSERSHEEHTAIVSAIARKDPDGAEAAMRLHLLHVADALRQASQTNGIHSAEEREYQP